MDGCLHPVCFLAAAYLSVGHNYYGGATLRAPLKPNQVEKAATCLYSKIASLEHRTVTGIDFAPKDTSQAVSFLRLD